MKTLQAILSEFLAPYLRQRWLGCLVVAVVNQREENIFSFGQISPGNPKSPDRNTIFELGSLTKPFTGILLADAVAKGKVSLEDPVATILPRRFRVPEYHMTGTRPEV